MYIGKIVQMETMNGGLDTFVRYIYDADDDGFAAEDDCDDLNPDVTNDCDGDGIVRELDCNDEDASIDGDCDGDGLVTAQDCDDSNPYWVVILMIVMEMESLLI